MDVRGFLERHERVRELILEGERLPELDEHAACCATCRALRARLDEIDRAIGDVPEPRPELLHAILRPRARDAEPGPATCRIETLWPSAGARPSPRRLLPLLLTVEADDFPAAPASQERVERHIILGRRPITIGRGPDLEVPIWDRSVSRRHVQLDWTGRGWVIRDLESTNGTRVNGLRLGMSELSYLKEGDRVELGNQACLRVRRLLPTAEPLAVLREVQRVLRCPVELAPERGDAGEPDEALRSRLLGLREETVRLRQQLSLIARRGEASASIPMVWEGLSNLLAMLERESQAVER